MAEDTQELAAGTWVDASSGPTVEFTVQDGWYVDGPPIEGVGLALAHSGFDGAYLAITPFDGSVFPAPCLTATTGEEFFEPSGTTIEASAASFADHLDAHPYVMVSGTTPVEIGGHGGIAIDMRSEVAEECDPPWAWLWQLPIVGDFHLNDGEDARFIALDVGDHVLVIAIEAFTGPAADAPAVDWPGFLEEVTALTDTMVITP